MSISQLRKEYHDQICKESTRLQRDDGAAYPNFADKGSKASREIAQGIVDRLGCPPDYESISGQTAGGLFETMTADFLERAFALLHHSCKWTLRSDRGQNARTEALNLIRNRKGHLAHVVAVTAEPLPTRIASLALGTGDLDCVYHFALPELQDSIVEIKNQDQMDMLTMMIEGRRLRDVSDLPFDLAA